MRPGNNVKLFGPIDRLHHDVRRGLFDFWFNRVLGSSLLPRDVRSVIYKLCGLEINGRANIYPNVRFRSRNISFGRQTMVNEDVFFDNIAQIRIGDSVAIGHQSMFVTSTHEVGPPTSRAGRLLSKPIFVEAGCWLGARVTVLPGVTIREGCVIAAGAVVVRDTDPHGLYAGTPAVRIKDLSPAILN